MLLLRFIAVALLAGTFAVLPGARSRAEPLDREACLELERQRSKLLTREMKAALERGPDWVKDHLDTGEIEKVREFLSVEEMIQFRCRGGGRVKQTATPGSGEAVPLPDRKPDPPQGTDDAGTVAAGSADMPLPDRKPGSATPAMGDVEPSQALVDSDKTAPSKTEAAR
ncbi:MAG TPA: hypothetical protein VFY74_12205 [Methyloceanibacter sp.]|jgi:hypothetical protein|nr:hypothetical protein [Methyloceanibacter sp.]